MTINPVLWLVVRPIASAASYCPLITDWRPPLTFSAKYAALKSVYPVTMAASSAISIPAGKNRGKMLEKKNSIVISGTPRTDSMYTVQSTRAIGIDDVRPSASNTPSGKLKRRVKTATNSVKENPPRYVGP